MVLHSGGVHRVFHRNVAAGQFLRPDSREPESRATHAVPAGHQSQGTVVGGALPREEGL